MVRERAFEDPTPGGSPPAAGVRTGGLKTASPSSRGVGVGASLGFAHVLEKERASRDHRGFAIALVANLAVLGRALPLMEFRALAPSVAYVVALAALLAWTLWGTRSYLRWRTPVQVAVRLDSLLMPYHRRVWAVFVNQPPKWHASTGAPVLNAAMLAASLLGQSYTGVLALLSFSHAVPLAIHMPVQLASTAAAISLSDDLCASALLNNKVASQLMQQAHSLLSLPALLLPLPIWPTALASHALTCRRVTIFVQVVLGLIVPTLVLAHIEQQAWEKYQLEQSRQQRSSGSTSGGPACQLSWAGLPVRMQAQCSRLWAVLLRWMRPTNNGLARAPSVVWLLMAALWLGICTAV